MNETYECEKEITETLSPRRVLPVHVDVVDRLSAPRILLDDFSIHVDVHRSWTSPAAAPSAAVAPLALHANVTKIMALTLGGAGNVLNIMWFFFSTMSDFSQFVGFKQRSWVS